MIFSCQSVQNLGLAVITIITGKIVEAYGYFWLEIFFISSLTGKKKPSNNPQQKFTIFFSVAFITVLMLWIMNAVKKGALNMTPSARELRQQSLLYVLFCFANKNRF